MYSYEITSYLLRTIQIVLKEISGTIFQQVEVKLMTYCAPRFGHYASRYLPTSTSCLLAQDLMPDEVLLLFFVRWGFR
jgi:hypothetical protein